MELGSMRSSRRARASAIRVAAAALAWLVAIASPAALGGEPGTPARPARGGAGTGAAKESPAETLKDLVGRLIALEVEANEDVTRWQEQKAHLETTLALLEKEKRQLDESLASAERDAGVARTEREALSRSIGEGEATLAAVDEAVERSGKRFLDSSRRCPEPVRALTEKGAAKVRDALYGKSGALTTAERLQLVSAFSQDCRRMLSTVHALKEVVQLPPDAAGRPSDGAKATTAGERIEADVLYLGGAIGYFVTPGDRAAGMIVRSAAGWKVVRRNDLAGAVRRALAVFSKESPPALVELPVVAPADRPEKKREAP
ncbi:MAG: DUF3450 family protein [Planctomycetota bacterium]|jgi:hypothetical protein